jgi:ankyrin repeat protein
VEMLTDIVEAVESYIDKKDQNGWTPLHEGARAGHVEVVELLAGKGANVNRRTHDGETTLWWAERSHDGWK